MSLSQLLVWFHAQLPEAHYTFLTSYGVAAAVQQRHLTGRNGSKPLTATQMRSNRTRSSLLPSFRSALCSTTGKVMGTQTIHQPNDTWNTWDKEWTPCELMAQFWEKNTLKASSRYKTVQLNICALWHCILIKSQISRELLKQQGCASQLATCADTCFNSHWSPG